MSHCMNRAFGDASSPPTAAAPELLVPARQHHHRARREELLGNLITTAFVGTGHYRYSLHGCDLIVCRLSYAELRHRAARILSTELICGVMDCQQPPFHHDKNTDMRLEHPGRTAPQAALRFVPTRAASRAICEAATSKFPPPRAGAPAKSRFCSATISRRAALRRAKRPAGETS